MRVTQASPSTPRTYRQDARARQTKANVEAIVRAGVALVRSDRRMADITLEDVSRASGLTVRTILRHFGSRDGVLEAAHLQLKEELSAARVETPPGDVEAAVRSLVSQYEEIGDFNMRALEQEHQLPLLHRALIQARGFHREWLTRTFAPQLARLSAAERERRVTALYAATDVYLWKLLRRDLHQDRRQTEQTFLQLVRGVLGLTARQNMGGK